MKKRHEIHAHDFDARLEPDGMGGFYGVLEASDIRLLPGEPWPTEIVVAGGTVGNGMPFDRCFATVEKASYMQRGGSIRIELIPTVDPRPTGKGVPQ